MIRIGYSGTNKTLNLLAGKGLTYNATQRGAVEARFKTNLENLHQILGWNFVNGILMYRMNVDMIPGGQHWDYKNIIRNYAGMIADIRLFIEDTKMRLTLHAPTQLVFTGNNMRKIGAARNTLTYYAALLDFLGTPDSVIVIHPGKRSWAQRERESDSIVRSLSAMPIDVKRYLVIENDLEWSVPEVHKMALQLRIPMVYDILHHACNPGVLRSELEYLTHGVSKSDVSGALLALIETNHYAAYRKTPKLHVSSQALSSKVGKHAAFVNYTDYALLRSAMSEVGLVDADIMVEATSNELAVLELRTKIELTRSRWRLHVGQYYL